jgi:hypothetical protein
MAREPKQEDRDTQRSKDEDNRWSKVLQYFLDNPTLVVTLFYLYFTAIGMLYSAVLYRNFGINIFDFSEIADFLLAAFKNPIALLAPGVQLVAYYITRYLDYLAPGSRGWMRRRVERRRFERERRHEADEGSTSGTIRTEEETRKPLALIGTRSLLVVSFVVAFTLILASGAATSIKDGNNPTVDIRYRSFSGSAGQVTEPNLTLIGATQKAVFFYDVDEKRTIVIPQAQIVSIEVPD